MEKALKLKEVAVIFNRVPMKNGEDWNTEPYRDLPAGLYMGVFPDGGICIWQIDSFGGRCGFWLPIEQCVKINVDQAKTATFEEIKSSLEAKLNAIDCVTNNSDAILNDMLEAKEQNEKVLLHTLAGINQNLVYIMNKVDGFEKTKGEHKSTLAEMSDAVVNIIKATK